MKLEEAFLCVECDCVYASGGEQEHCPACGCSVSLSLSRVMNRRHDEVLPYALPTPLMVLVSGEPQADTVKLVTASMITRKDEVTFIDLTGGRDDSRS
jgi:hypothetical protein